MSTSDEPKTPSETAPESPPEGALRCPGCANPIGAVDELIGFCVVCGDPVSAAQRGYLSPEAYAEKAGLEAPPSGPTLRAVKKRAQERAVAERGPVEVDASAVRSAVEAGTDFAGTQVAMREGARQRRSEAWTDGWYAGDEAATHDQAGARCCDNPGRHKRQPPDDCPLKGTWREGFKAGYDDASRDDDGTPNPYETEEERGEGVASNKEDVDPVGSSFDDFLEKEGLLDEVNAEVSKRVEERTNPSHEAVLKLATKPIGPPSRKPFNVDVQTYTFPADDPSMPPGQRFRVECYERACRRALSEGSCKRVNDRLLWLIDEKHGENSEAWTPELQQEYDDLTQIMNTVERLGRPPETPIDLILQCPECGARHVDEGAWATKNHHTHACQECGFVWRPAVQATRGVQHLPGFKNPEDKISVGVVGGGTVGHLKKEYKVGFVLLEQLIAFSEAADDSCNRGLEFVQKLRQEWSTEFEELKKRFDTEAQLAANGDGRKRETTRCPVGPGVCDRADALAAAKKELEQAVQDADASNGGLLRRVRRLEADLKNEADVAKTNESIYLGQVDRAQEQRDEAQKQLEKAREDAELAKAERDKWGADYHKLKETLDAQRAIPVFTGGCHAALDSLCEALGMEERVVFGEEGTNNIKTLLRRCREQARRLKEGESERNIDPNALLELAKLQGLVNNLQKAAEDYSQSGQFQLVSVQNALRAGHVQTLEAIDALLTVVVGEPDQKVWPFATPLHLEPGDTVRVVRDFKTVFDYRAEALDPTGPIIEGFVLRKK